MQTLRPPASATRMQNCPVTPEGRGVADCVVETMRCSRLLERRYAARSSLRLQPNDAIADSEIFCAMRDHDDCRRRRDGPQAFKNGPFSVAVDRAGCFVEQQKPWSTQNRAGECDALALAPGDQRAAFSQHSIQTFFHSPNEFV